MPAGRQGLTCAVGREIPNEQRVDLPSSSHAFDCADTASGSVETVIGIIWDPA